MVAEALRYRERAVRGGSSQSVARSVSVALLVVLVACSGGSGGNGSRASSKGTASPTTAPAPTIDLSKPIPGGSLHGTPRPPLQNTGTDYVAIFKSLDGSFRWLTENPDPAVISDIYVPGTRIHDLQLDVIQKLAENGWRAADEGYRVLSVELLDTRPGVVSLRLTDQFDLERIVDSAGQQVGEGKPHSESTVWNILLSSEGQGRWRIADASVISGQQVQL
jgi:hypothetical protein